MDAGLSRIGDAVREARAHLLEHPDEARYTDSAATARLEGGRLRVTVRGPEGVALTTDNASQRGW